MRVTPRRRAAVAVAALGAMVLGSGMVSAHAAVPEEDLVVE